MPLVNKDYSTGVNQAIQIVGAGSYFYDNIEMPVNGFALYDANTGIGGVDYIPANGDTVVIVAGYELASTKVNPKDFIPVLGNTVSYIVSEKQYTQSEIYELASSKEVLSAVSTAIAMTYDPVLKISTGTFVFNNPNDYEYFYLIFDYSDRINTNSIVSINAYYMERFISVRYNNNIGVAGIDMNVLDQPARLQMYWNNSLVADTGYIGLNTLQNYNDLIALGIDESLINLTYPYDGLVNNGSEAIRFNKYIDLREAKIVLSAPIDGSIVELQRAQPTLTAFYIEPVGVSVATVCSQIPQTEYYHDGSNTLPTVGDRIYTTFTGSSLFEANDLYYQVSTTPLIVPPVTGGQFVSINARGIVTEEGGCDCNEIAVPNIAIQNFFFIKNQQVSVKLAALNNPTSWSIVTSCNEYLLEGGTTGTIFNITDCEYGAKVVTVNINQSLTVCSSTAPSVAGGSGSSTLVGPCADFVLPNGLSLDASNGIIYGTALDDCEFSIDLQATNCFGTSATETVTITIVSDNVFKPFLIDIENFGDDSTAACALSSPLYSVLYHNGAGDVPTLGDVIVRTMANTINEVEAFFGGNRWYKIYNSSDVLKICNSGKVCDIYTCP